MKEDLIDWLNFHADVLGKHKFPCFVWGVGTVLMLFSQYLYPYILQKFYNMQIFSQYLFRDTIEKNLNYLVHGLWIIPLIIFMFFFMIGIKIHQDNIRRIYKY